MNQCTVRILAAIIGGVSMSALMSNAADMPTNPLHPMYFVMRSTMPAPQASAGEVAYNPAANPRHPTFTARSNAPANPPAIIFQGAAAHESERNPLHPSYKR